MYFRVYIYFLLFFVGWGQIYGKPLNDKYSFKWFSVKDGLPSPFINNIYEDGNQRIWIGTNAGIVSFDGYDFKQYSGTKGLQSEKIYDQVEDDLGCQWVAGNKGIDRIDLKGNIHPVFSKEGITIIEKDTSGNIWSSDNGYIYFFDVNDIREFNANEKKKQLEPLVINTQNPINIFDLKCDGWGNIYVSTKNKIFHVNEEKELVEIIHSKLEKSYINFLLPVSKDSLIWCTKAGVAHLTTRDSTIFITNIYEDDFYRMTDLSFWERKLCFLTDFEVFLMKDSSLYSIKIPNDWNIKGLHCLLPDRRGNLWVGTTEGIILITPKLFQNENYPSTYPEVYSFLEDETGILLGTNQGKVFKYQQGELSESQPHKVLPAAEILEIFKDHKGGKWFISYWQGVSRYYNNELEYFFYGHHKEEEPDFFSGMQASDKSIWLGSVGNVWKIEIDWETGQPKSFENYSLPQGGKCEKIIELDEGKITIATSNGLYQWNGQGFKRCLLPNLPANTSFKDILQEEGRIWMASQGLGVMSGRLESDGNMTSISVFNTQKGLINDFVESIELDEQDNLWAATFTGLSKIDPKGNVHNYNQDGLTDKTYLNIRLFREKSGLIWCATSQGVYTFNPKKIGVQTEDANSHFVSISVNGKETTRERRKFSYYENSFQFSFIHIHISKSDLIRYSYRLQGLNEQWSSPTTERTVRYDFLPSGKYLFEVRTRNASGKWSSAPLTYHFTVQPPFWDTWWFRTAFLAALVLTIWAFIRWRNLEFRKKERERSHFRQMIAELETKALRVQMNPHFVFNCMSAIQEQILMNEVDAAYSYLSKFSKLMRMVLESSSSHGVLLENEFKILSLYLELESLRFDNAFQYHIEHDPENDFVSIPSLMIQPFVENAIWHGLLHNTKERKLDIRFGVDGNYIKCEIIDNGIGRRKAQELQQDKIKTHQSMAMQLIHERLDWLNTKSALPSTLQIIDLKNQKGLPNGTHVILKIPVDWQKNWKDGKGK